MWEVKVLFYWVFLDGFMIINMDVVFKYLLYCFGKD